MKKRLITERDYAAVETLRGIAIVLRNQVDEIGETIGAILGVAAVGDAMTDLLWNDGSLKDFLSESGLRAVRNGGVDRESPPQPRTQED